MGVEIKPSEHVLICGRTGTGKTFLARKYLAGFPFVVCLDTKGTMAWPEVPREQITIVKNLLDLPDVTTPKIIYQPVFEELKPEYYNQFFQWCYRRGNTIVWVDEAFSVSPNAQVLPEYYRAILTRGRELGVACWSCTQRPSGIAQIIISEATHYFTFDLNLDKDRAKLADMTGQPEMHQKPGKYNFWYYNVYADKCVKARLTVKSGKGGGQNRQQIFRRGT